MPRQYGGGMALEQPLLTFPEVSAWRAWLDENESSHDGAWVLLAKKGTTTPTSMTYDEALLEALCSGWIDGQLKSVDASTYKQRFTPRRARSMWSARNVRLVAELQAAGRMRPRGLVEVERAQADGRWERAYEGSADIQVPEDLYQALDAAGKRAAFDGLKRSERYSVLHPVVTSPTPETRARRIARAVDRLG